MRTLSTTLLIGTTVALVGCDQTSQDPLSPGEGEEIRVTIDADQGGRVSHPEGLGVEFPAGSLPSTMEIGLNRIAADGLDEIVRGSVLDGSVYRIAPEGTELEEPARVDALMRGIGSLSAQERLALSAALVVDGDAEPLAVSTLDLSSSILRTRIDRLGVVAGRVADDLLPLESGDPENEMDGGSLFVSDGSTEDLMRSTYTLSCEGTACLDVLALVAGPAAADGFADRVGAIRLTGSATLVFERDLTTENRGTVEGSLSEAFEVRMRGAGSITGEELDLSIVVPEDTRYAIQDNRIEIGGETFFYRTFDEDGARHLELHVPTATVTLGDSEGDEEVRVATRMRLERIDD